VNSLADSTNSITFSAGGTSKGPLFFRWGSGAVSALTLNNRQIVFSGVTTVNTGSLLVNNTTGPGNVTVNSGGTLGGTGTIGGAVTVNAGGTLSPGASLGTLTLSGNLTLNAGSTNIFVVNGGTPTNSAVVLGGTLTCGGVLNIVTNGAFTAGQTFQLFSGAGPSNAGNFANIAGSPGNGLSFAFTNGVLSVVSTALTPPTLSGWRPLSGTSFPLTFSGPSGQTYSVLSSTNVALPLSSWTTQSSGIFGASPVNYTDTNATNAQQFYRIQSP